MYEYPEKWDEIPYMSVHPHEYLQTRLPKSYSYSALYNSIQMVDFHKLSWKSDFGYDVSSGTLIEFLLDSTDDFRQIIGYSIKRK